MPELNENKINPSFVKRAIRARVLLAGVAFEALGAEPTGNQNADAAIAAAWLLLGTYNMDSAKAAKLVITLAEDMKRAGIVRRWVETDTPDGPTIMPEGFDPAKDA